jgi:hypothetical protein
MDTVQGGSCFSVSHAMLPLNLYILLRFSSPISVFRELSHVALAKSFCKILTAVLQNLSQCLRHRVVALLCHSKIRLAPVRPLQMVPAHRPRTHRQHKSLVRLALPCCSLTHAPEQPCDSLKHNWAALCATLQPRHNPTFPTAVQPPSLHLHSTFRK